MVTQRYTVEDRSAGERPMYYVLDTQQALGGQWVETRFSLEWARDYARFLNRQDDDPVFAAWVLVNEARHRFSPLDSAHGQMLRVERYLAQQCTAKSA